MPRSVPCRTRRMLLTLLAVAAATALHVGTARAAEADSIPLAIELHTDGRTLDAEAMLRRLAEAGDAEAMERLGLWHLYGERLLGPGPWSRSEAMRWLGHAAEQGRPIAQRLVNRHGSGALASR
jgi:TPR repeat protein